jgi:hypothetical protein
MMSLHPRRYALLLLPLMAFPVMADEPVTNLTCEEFSPNAKLVFTCVAPNTEEGPRGTLYSVVDGKRRPMWAGHLLNVVRPRFVNVTDDGYVVTFDDPENEPSINAIVVFDPTGKLVFHLSTRETAKILKISLEDLAKATEQSKCGLWLQSRPETKGKQVEFRAARKIWVLTPPDNIQKRDPAIKAKQ